MQFHFAPEPPWVEWSRQEKLNLAPGRTGCLIPVFDSQSLFKHQVFIEHSVACCRQLYICGGVSGNMFIVNTDLCGGYSGIYASMHAVDTQLDIMSI